MILHKIQLDMQSNITKQVMYAKQEDSMSRTVQIELYNGGTEWPVPEEVTILQIAYSKPDRTGGVYDTLPDGSKACTTQGNRVECKLHPQMFTAAGKVCCEFRMLNEQGLQLGTFYWVIFVEESVTGKLKSEDYFNFASLSNMREEIGILADLRTKAKKDIVAAINELHDYATTLTKTVNGVSPDPDTGDVRVIGEDIHAFPANIPDFKGSVDDALDILGLAVFHGQLGNFKRALENYARTDDILGIPVLDTAGKKYGKMAIIGTEEEMNGKQNFFEVPTLNTVKKLLSNLNTELSGGLDFDSGYVDPQGYIHLTLGGEEIPGFTPFYIGSASEAPGDLLIEGDRLYLSKDGEPVGEGVELPKGGGTGSGSVMKLLNGLGSSAFSLMDTAKEAVILYSWSSVDAEDGTPTGKGSASWFVGDRRVATQSVEQGECSFDILPYLETGVANTVKLTLEDAYGTVRSRIWTVTVISFGLSWDLEQMDSHPSAPMSVRFIPTGMGDKTLRLYIDDREHHVQTVASTGRTVTVDIPALPHGVHRITATLELVAEGQTVTTDPLTHVGIWHEESSTEAVVAFYDTAVEVAQYATAGIAYLVYDPVIENAAITLYDNGAEVRNLTVGRGMQIWAYRPTAEGQTTLQIAVDHTDARASLPVTVTALGYDIAPVSAGLLLECNPAGHSNAETDRESFGYTDGQGQNHPFVFSPGFDWVSGGFRQDDEGITALVIKRGTSVTLDRSFFQGDATSSGREIKLILKVTNCRDYEARFLHCYDAPVGLVLRAQEGVLSSESQSLTIPYCEEEKLEIDLNIEALKEHRLATVWLSGIPSGVFVYGTTDAWVQSNPDPVVIGSEDCDVWLYGLRMYGNSLTLQDILANYIADAGTTEEILARYERNDIYAANGSLSLSKLRDNNPDLRILHISAGDMTTGKEHEVSCSVDLDHKNGKGFTASGVIMKAQGTSSLEYGMAALNLDLDFSSAKWTDDKGETITAFSMAEAAVPVNYFNIKLNVASSENANNVCLAEEYNRHNPYRSMPREDHPAIRDTVEGHPCAVFLTNTGSRTMTVGARSLLPGETMLYGCGDMNNSKKNFAVFGQDNSTYPKQCCIEILNNNNAPCRFKSDDLTTETWDGAEGTSNFEFRYPKNPTQEMKDSFRALLSWVVSTDPTQATGQTLPRPAQYAGRTYNTDTGDYRRAKFRAELAEYFAVDSLLFHYLFTEYHLMVDNRAKNTFLSYEWDKGAGKYLWNFNKDYDNDTAAGTDNSGGLSFTYGMEDTDSVGAQKVFNAWDSVLWCNLRDLFAPELKTMYHSLESQKVWDRERILEVFRTYQSARPEILVAEDMWAKYFTPYIHGGERRYLAMAQGNKTLQRAAFYRYRQSYMSSKYDSPFALSDSLSLRANAVSDLSVTLYSDAYAHVRFGNAGSVKVRGKRGESIPIPCKADTANDLETYLYSAGSISVLGDLSGLMADQIELNSAVKLRNLPLGSGDPGYGNEDLTQLSFGTITALESIDLRGLSRLSGAVDLTQFDGLRELLASGSGISGVILAPNCPIETLDLPPVGTLVLRGHRQLSRVYLDTHKLQNLRLEDCPHMDSMDLCRNAPSLQRGRVTGVSWQQADADLLLRLSKLSGYDGEGLPTDTFVLTGRAHVPAVCEEELESLHRAFPNLELTYDTVVPGYTVTFCGADGSVLYTCRIRHGGVCPDPVAEGRIPTPTMASTTEHSFRYVGWDLLPETITGDVTVTALFAPFVRWYKVRWFNGSQLLQEDVVEVYDSVSYKGQDLRSDTPGVIWIGWDKDQQELDAVTRDMDVHGVYLYPRLPDGIKIQYDYLYSDDPGDFSAYSLAEFYGIIHGGVAQEYFNIGDKVKLKLRSSAVTDTEIILQVYGFRQYECAGEVGGCAQVVFGMVGVMDQNMKIMSTSDNVGGWKASGIRAFLNDTLYSTLPIHWRGMIKTVEVRSSVGGQSGEIQMTEDKLFLFAYSELFNSKVQPYSNEVARIEDLPYTLFTDSTSRIKNKYNGTGGAARYWTRSPDAGDSIRYMLVGPNGSTDWQNAPAGNAAGIAFGFCI